MARAVLQIQAGLHSVAGATLQSHTPVASGGPNLVLNGDFTYDSSGTQQDTPSGESGSLWGLVVPGEFSWTVNGIQSWETSGGGQNTYAAWGSKIDYQWSTSNAPPPAGPSMM